MKEMNIRFKPLRFLMRLVQVYLRHNVPRSAAQISYYLLLSLFPVVMVVISIVGLLQLDVDSVMRILESLPITNDVLREYVTYVVTNESPALMWAGIIMAITASSAAFRGIMQITGEICGRPTFGGVVQFGVSLVMSMVLLLTIFVCLLATVTGRWFLNWLAAHIHVASALLEAWQWLRFPLIFALGVCALTAIYRVSLSKKALPHGKAWPGAVFSSIGLVIGTAVFSLFIGMSSRYSMVYGSLASIIILMLWFFLCGNILVLGNVVNFVLAKEKSDDDPTITFRLY